jgi:hypothetical protein
LSDDLQTGFALAQFAARKPEIRENGKLGTDVPESKRTARVELFRKRVEWRASISGHFQGQPGCCALHVEPLMRFGALQVPLRDFVDPGSRNFVLRFIPECLNDSFTIAASGDSSPPPVIICLRKPQNYSTVDVRPFRR